MSSIDLLKKVIFANLVTYEVLHGQRRYVIVGPSVCLSSVIFVRPTQAIEIFRNVFTPRGRLAFDLCIKFYGGRPRGTPPSGELNTREVSE